MKLKTKLSKLRHEGHITDAEYSIIINVLNKFSAQPPKTQPCEDAISRAEALRIAKSYYHAEYVVDKIRQLPPVTSWSDWIPATQLPEPNTAVLLYVKYKSSRQRTYQLGMWNDSKLAWEDWRTPYDLEEEFEIIAWMELPEIYEEEQA